jgi:hypothetical protein
MFLRTPAMGPSVNECDANPGSPFRSYWQASVEQAILAALRASQGSWDHSA